MKRITLFSRTRIGIAILLGFTACIAAAIDTWKDHSGDPRSVIQQTEELIADFGRTEHAAQQRQLTADQFLDAPTWKDLDSKFNGLSYSNRRTARARAMLYLAKVPTLISYIEWDERHENARTPWAYSEQSEHLYHTITVCVAVLLIWTVGGWLISLVLSWIWYFFLNRISELVTAMRGQS